MDNSKSKAENVMDNQKETMNDFLTNAEEMISISELLSSVTEQVNEQIEKAATFSENGITEMQQTKEDINEIESSNIFLSEKVDRLSSLSNNLIDIIKLLKKISTQTNMLALNASIEAARAGSAGAGFDVVAKEVRKLAEESEKMTKKADISIEDILNEINQVEKVTSEGKAKTEKGVQSIKRTEEHFYNINKAIEGVSSHKEELKSNTSKLSNTTQKAASISYQISENRKIIAEELKQLVDEHNSRATK